MSQAETNNYLLLKAILNLANNTFINIYHQSQLFFYYL